MPLATLVCLLCALPLLSPLVRGEDWWLPAVLMMGAATAVSVLYRTLADWAGPVVPVLQLAVVALLVVPLFAGHLALLGVVPTGAAVEHVATVFSQGLGTIDTNTPPVTATAGVMLIIAVAFAGFLVAADFLAVTARCPGMVGGLLLALAVVPLVVEESGIGAGALVVCVFGFLQLLAVDMWVRGREWGVAVPAPPLGALQHGFTAALAAAAAVALALALPAAVPGLRTDAFHALAQGTYVGRGNDIITTTHPLVSMRRDLLSDSDRTVLTYRTDAEEPGYLRRYVLDEFDGVDWTMSPVDASGDTRIRSELPLPTGWPSAAPPQDTVTTRVSLDSDVAGMDFLPLPYWARSVDVSGDWYVHPDSLMVFTTEGPPTGLSFTVETAEREVTARELAAAPRAPRSLPGDFRTVPAELGGEVGELTEELTGHIDAPYLRAVALQEFFTSGDFSYSLRPPEVPAGADPLVHFLTVDRTGYCQQFAGAMAVMARQAGIPARVAVGYTAGERVGDGRWSVGTGDAHAWPELYFEGAGWVRFEPTPSGAGGQGSATEPEYTSGATAPEPADPEPSPEDPDEEPSATPEPEESPSPSAPPAEEESPQEVGAAPADGDGRAPDLSWLPAAAAVAGALLVPFLPAGLRLAVRHSRLGRPGAAWRELRDTCVDLGLGWDLAESPRGTAARLAALRDAQRVPLPEEVRAALHRLALAEERDRYAPAASWGEEAGADLRTVVGGLPAVRPRGVRLRAVLLPRSLWDRPRRPVADPTPQGA